MISSGTITAFSGIIASAGMGGEAKLVQRGTYRIRIFIGVGGDMGGGCPTERGDRVLPPLFRKSAHGRVCDGQPRFDPD